ncbi:MAG: glycosyltransferase family A protein [Eubacteriales bacterium]|nr:glycosyltransferase family A protein [Eubacteriales bacterium]
MKNASNLHTFAVCAYKESEYLEACIRSLMNQKQRSRIILCTSTDSEFLRNMAKKYALPYYVKDGASDLADDWNFAYSMADTPYVTIAHQDDVYVPGYTERMIADLEADADALIWFCHYFEIRGGEDVYADRNLDIKKTLLLPLKSRRRRGSTFWKRRVLSMGNPICCPAVTYVKARLPERPFHSGMKSNVDWETWEAFTHISGSFVYNEQQLMGHRVHEDSTTTEIIRSNTRTLEDRAMLDRFWPKPVAGLINHVYKNAEKSNQIEK